MTSMLYVTGAQRVDNDWWPMPSLLTRRERVGGLFHFAYPAGTSLVSDVGPGQGLPGAAAERLASTSPHVRQTASMYGVIAALHSPVRSMQP
jgi:hypothetical protein